MTYTMSSGTLNSTIPYHYLSVSSMRRHDAALEARSSVVDLLDSTSVQGGGQWCARVVLEGAARTLKRIFFVNNFRLTDFCLSRGSISGIFVPAEIRLQKLSADFRLDVSVEVIQIYLPVTSDRMCKIIITYFK